MRESRMGERRLEAQNSANNDAYMERRREIMSAAARVFKRQGYQGTSLTMVAEELQTDRANLYYYFGSKEELFQATVTDAIESNLAQARAISREATPAAERLRRILTGLMQSYEDHYPVLYVYIQENLSHVSREGSDWDKATRSVNRAYERVLMTVIEEGFVDGSLRQVAPSWLITNGILGMFGWTNRWFDPARSKMNAAEIGEMFADLLLKGLEGGSRKR